MKKGRDMGVSFRAAILLTVAASIATGCASQVFTPAAAAGFDAHPTHEIDDDSIRQAFEAKPQMAPQIRVAYYSFDPSKAEAIEEMIKEQPGVVEVYQIPSLLLTGERRESQLGTRPSHHHHRHGFGRGRAEPFSLKRARLLAARARCDALILFDHGYRIESEPNAWVVSAVALLPLLVVPFLSADVSSYLDVYVFDTRNGYLYAQQAAQREDRVGPMTIYSDADQEALNLQWDSLIQGSREVLTQILAKARQQTDLSPVTGNL